MSIGGIMQTSSAGMNVQASRLSTVSENIANSDTTGYKRSDTEFSSLVLPQTTGSYTSGSVTAQTRTMISEAGTLTYTGKATDSTQLDLALDGDGFFVVGDGSGGNFLTRAGSFVQLSDGTLVNSAGYKLQGYPIGLSGTDSVLNGFAGLQDVNLSAGLLSASPTTQGLLTVPLNKAFVAGTTGSYTQATGFVASGGASNLGGDKLKFSIAIDGGSAIPVTVASKPTSSGIPSIQNSDIVAAINSTTGLSNVASLDSGGRLVLKSNSGKTGGDSTVALSAIAQTTAGDAPKSGADLASLSGLTAFGAVDATGAPAARPGDNTANLPSAKSTIMHSMTVYNNSGEAVKLDVYYTKVDDLANRWEVAVFDSRKGATGTTTAPFPYTPTSEALLAKATLTFDSATFKLQTITPAVGTGQVENRELVINLASIGGSTFNLDIGNTTQYTGNTPPLAAEVDGNPAEVIDRIAVGENGVVTAQFTSGTTRDLFKIPLTKVQSPNKLVAVSGNAYAVGIESGTVLMGTGGEGGFGKVVAGALENSNVDLANELTDMISAQRSYTANSKVFQTGSEILDVLVNLKR